jgi:hypothetical protein
MATFRLTTLPLIPQSIAAAAGLGALSYGQVCYPYILFQCFVEIRPDFTHEEHLDSSMIAQFLPLSCSQVVYIRS